MSLRFGSVCSGIEAASVAFNPLGWQAAWLSEIEPFPSAVLAHHYPDVPNLGDMTTIAERIRAGLVEAPDMLCGGTPCQAFSVAGQRRSLSDERGNLSLVFCELADAIDDQRFFDGLEPCIVFWENVPGVLSTGDNAFGCFLGQLAGEDCALDPPGGRWADAGAVFGPKRAIAWRVLDAQYFGLAQRRRRVFVVASARAGFDPAAVLFEFDGVRRDHPPSRESGEDTAGSTGDGVARCVTAGEMKRQDWETCTMVAQPVAFHHNAQACQLPGPGRDTSVSDALTCSQQAAVSYAIQAGALRTNPNSGPDGVGVLADHAYTLEARAEVQAVATVAPLFCHRCGEYDVTDGVCDWCGRTDAVGANHPNAPIAFSCKDYGADAGAIAPTLRSMGHSGSHANGGGQVAVAVTGDVFHTLRAEGFDASEDGTGRGTHDIGCGSGGGQASVAVAIRTAQTGSNGWGINTEGTAYTLDSAQQAVAYADIMPTMTCGGGHAASHNQVSGQMRDAYIVPTTAMKVRRLTPVECSRLQGFPDDYLTQVPWRGKPTPPDGPMYKALGNSWAVPVVRWIGQRISNAVR